MQYLNLTLFRGNIKSERECHVEKITVAKRGISFPLPFFCVDSEGRRKKKKKDTFW